MRHPFLLLTAVPAFLTGAVSSTLAQEASPPEVTHLDKVTVFAGQYPTGEQPGAVLNSLEVVRTPGAAGDINRALQTLPGIQIPDEGNALFVRGGDSAETSTLVNGVKYPSATKLTQPTGTFAGTLNPFEARRITFMSGGFGARFGNALSGIVDLDTLGAPPADSLTIGGGMGAISLGGTVTAGEHAGIRLTDTRSNMEPFFRLNGASRDYPEAPNGHDLALSGAWEYRPGAEVRFFGVEQLQHMAIDINTPAARGRFYQSNLNRLGTVTWADSFGPWSYNLSAGGGTLDRREAIDPTDVRTVTQHRQLAARVGYDAGERVQLSAGVDGAREDTTLTKLIPPAGSYAGGLFAAELPGTRMGVFGEADVALMSHLRVVAGARADNSTLTHQTTADPRLSLAWEPQKAVTFSFAGGVYHQIPEAYYFFGDTGRLKLPPMRANQLIGAMQVGKEDRLVRLEVYTKDYADLAALTRNYRSTGGGTGRAQGLDLFAKTSLPWAMTGRFTYSYVDTRRTDPDSGQMARAPFDVPHTVAILVERAFGGWVAGAGWRYSSGRPYTPVVSGVPDGRGGYAPVYGAPFSETLPPLLRLDLNASRYYRLSDHTALVVYVSVNNVLNRGNVYTYEYSSDFSTRTPTPSLFRRGFYFGFTLMFN